MKVLYPPGQLSNWSDKTTFEGEIVLIEALVKQAFGAGTIPAIPINSFGKKLFLFTWMVRKNEALAKN